MTRATRTPRRVCQFDLHHDRSHPILPIRCVCFLDTKTDSKSNENAADAADAELAPTQMELTQMSTQMSAVGADKMEQTDAFACCKAMADDGATVICGRCGGEWHEHCLSEYYFMATTTGEEFTCAQCGREDAILSNDAMADEAMLNNEAVKGADNVAEKRTKKEKEEKLPRPEWVPERVWEGKKKKELMLSRVAI